MRKIVLFVLLLIPLMVGAEEFKKEDPQNPLYLIKTSMGDIYVELFIKEAPKTVKNFIDLAEGKKEFKDPKSGEKVKKPFFDGLIFHRIIKNFMIQGGCPLGNGMGDPGYKFEDEINAKALGLDKIKAFDMKKGSHPSLLIRSRQQFQVMMINPILKKLGVDMKKLMELRKANPEEFKKQAKELNEKLMAELKDLTIQKAFENLGYKYDEKLKSHHPKRGVLAMANSGPGTNGSQFFINVKDTPWLTGKHTVFGRVVKGMDIVDKISLVEVGEQAKPKEDVKIISIRVYKEKKEEGVK